MTKAVERALEDGCEALQVFNKSSSQWAAKVLTRDECEAFSGAVRDAKLPVISHGSYLINLASPDPMLLKKSTVAFALELERCDRLGIPWLVTHPGAPIEEGCEEIGIERIARAIDSIYD